MPPPMPGFGLILSNRAPVLDYGTAADLVELGVAAEASGLFDTVWSGDAFLTNPRLDAITLLAAVAARTRTVRLGPACMGSFTQRSVLDLAYQWASLDLISGGRTVMVACAGGGSSRAWDREGRHTGIEPAERRALMWERIEVMRALWSGEPVRYCGRYHDLDGVRIVPAPSRPNTPVWAATNITRLATGVSSGRMPTRTLATVGRLCDGWMTHSVSPQTFTGAWEHILAAADGCGRDPGALDNALVINLCVRDSAAEALEESREFLADYYGIRFSAERTGEWTAHGPPEACAERLSGYRASGVRHLAIRLVSRDQAGQFDRLVDEVLPLVSGGN